MVEPRLEHISVEELHFDTKNPRLPDSVNHQDERDVLRWMLRKGDIVDLMESIATTGYSSAEPVLAIPREDGGYEVVEGNRRLAAVKLLLNPGAAPVKERTVNRVVAEAENKPEKIPVLVYPKREDVLSYLGYRHITGVKSWGPLEKAKYLQQLFELYCSDGTDEDIVFRKISRIVATKPHFAKKTLTVLNLVELASENDFWGIDGLSEEDIDFSVFGTAIGYESIYNYIGLESSGDWTCAGLKEKRVSELLSWLFEKNQEGKSRLGESRNIRTLAYVVGTPTALKAFQGGRSLRESAEYTAEADENYRKFILKALDSIQQAEMQSNRLVAPDEDDVLILRELLETVKRLGLFVKSKIENEQEF